MAEHPRSKKFFPRLMQNSSAEFRKQWQFVKLNLSWVSNRTLTTDILTVSLTKRCNLNCTYCWDFNQRPKLNELETDEIKKLLLSAKKLGVRSFNPFGGEPFIRKDAVEIIEFAFSLGFVVSVTTNGTLLTEEKLRRLVECVPKTGELVVLVSLDGSSAEENDFIRDPGSFEKTTRTIRKLHELRVELGRPVGLVVNTVVSRNNFRSMVRQVHLAQELGADQVHFITPIVNGGVVADGMVKRNLFIYPDEFSELDGQIDAVLELKRNSERALVLNNPSSLENFKGFYRRQFEHHEALIAANEAGKEVKTFAQAKMS
ncbi:hypothetical protein BH10BDE1_BH10BDE1_25440 [soil metagenome]